MLAKEKITKIKKSLDRADERLPLLFGVLGEKGRYLIFKLLIKKQDVCVTDIAHVLGISVPAASQQLKILELAGLVRRERTGQTVCYIIKNDDPVVRSVIKLLSHQNYA